MEENIEYKRKKLAIVTTHPIQYNAPFFKMLTGRGHIDIKVFYTWGVAASSAKFDPGFGRSIAWDIPLLEGYEYEFLLNTSKDPGSHHFRGVRNPEIIDRLISYKPDAIMVYGWSFESHLKVMRYFRNKVLIYFKGDSTLLNESSFFSVKKVARRVWLRWVYSQVDYAFFVGESNKEYFVKHGIKKDKLIHVPHAVDNLRFAEPDAEYLAESLKIKNDLSIPFDKLVFLFAGKLEEIKNVQLLLESFCKASVSDASVLVIVGNGSLERRIKSNYKANPSIFFMDFQNQKSMPLIYRLADVFVLPSKSETWGLSVNEAMACGCAILVNDKCGCAKDLLVEGKNGYLFEEGNASDLSLKLGLFVKKATELEAMKIFSKNWIKNYSYEVGCLNLERLMQNESATVSPLSGMF